MDKLEELDPQSAKRKLQELAQKNKKNNELANSFDEDLEDTSGVDATRRLKRGRLEVEEEEEKQADKSDSALSSDFEEPAKVDCQTTTTLRTPETQTLSMDTWKKVLAISQATKVQSIEKKRAHVSSPQAVKTSEGGQSSSSSYYSSSYSGSDKEERKSEEDDFAVVEATEQKPNSSTLKENPEEEGEQKLDALPTWGEDEEDYIDSDIEEDFEREPKAKAKGSPGKSRGRPKEQRLREGTVAHAVYHVLRHCKHGKSRGLSGAQLAYIINQDEELLLDKNNVKKEISTYTIYSCTQKRDKFFRRNPQDRKRLMLRDAGEGEDLD